MEGRRGTGKPKRHDQEFIMTLGSSSAKGGARNFCLGGLIFVANLLVYTNFYIYTQTHVSIHTHTKLISFIMNP